MTSLQVQIGQRILSLGLYQARWHGLFAIEKNPCAFATLKYNLIDRKKHFEWPKYDQNGNMTKDLNRNISSIQYNLLNLPQNMTYSNNRSTTYVYDATGRKLQVEYVNPATTFDYCGNMIYVNGTHGLDMYDYGARFYDPSICRFTTMDPMCEKYYNLSPYIYCGNNPINTVDMKGDSLFVLNAPDGANGNGHLAILIQNSDKKWNFYSKNGTEAFSGLYGMPNSDNRGDGSFSSVEEFLNSDNYNPMNEETGKRKYTEGYLIPSTPEEDKKAVEGAMLELEKFYNVIGSNCAVTVQSALKAAGKDAGYPKGIRLSPFTDNAVSFADYIIRSKVPNRIYQQIKLKNQGIIIKPRNK